MLRGLEVIERNVRAQTQLIEDLLDVSRIITGKLRLEVRPIDLAPVVEAGRGGGAALRGGQGDPPRPWTSRPDMPRSLGDPDRLQQVVWNLVTNAVKFTPRGRAGWRCGCAGTTRTSTSRCATPARGIPADFLPHVFERFRQADSTSTRAHGGLGLGLAIVRHLVELHGGTVHAESAGDGQGATFTVQPAASLAPAAQREPTPARPRRRRRPAPVRLDGVRVLVVDDETDVRDFLSISLAQYGAEVTALALRPRRRWPR